ncbi:MAG: hypothetical protein E6719_00020 [Dermabacter sp.]|nr:hypothetical protein [Dermabacter sp.]
MTDPEHQRDPSAALEELARSFSTLEENFKTAIRQTAAHIHEALTKSAEDIKNDLDLTK